MQRATTERKQLLRHLENLFEVPLVILGFAWLVLLVVELVYGGSPVLETVGVVIWIIFIVDFALKFILAPEKVRFLKQNVLTLLSLVVPAFRVLRIFRMLRLLRFTRGIRLVKVIGTLNRSIRALSHTMKRRGIGYVLALTLIVVFAGAAGMYAFEKDVPSGLSDYGTALWWTTMIMTTLGSEYWPHTPEGRILCVVLALFAFAVFGYITATIASFFVGRDAEDAEGEVAGTKQIAELKEEVRELKAMLIELHKKVGKNNS